MQKNVRAVGNCDGDAHSALSGSASKTQLRASNNRVNLVQKGISFVASCCISVRGILTVACLQLPLKAATKLVASAGRAVDRCGCRSHALHGKSLERGGRNVAAHRVTCPEPMT